MVLLLHLQHGNRRSRCRSYTEDAGEHQARERKNEHGVTKHTAFLSGQYGAIEERHRISATLEQFRFSKKDNS
jgi:hypothetical protein